MTRLKPERKYRRTSMSKCALPRVCGMIAALVLVSGQTRGDDKPVFETDVRPVFAQKCGQCHGDTAREANLDLRTGGAILRGGDSGPAVSQNGLQSLLWERIESGEMPPEDHPQLLKKEKEKIRQWLQSGAVFANNSLTDDAWTKRLAEAREYWAFQPVTRPPVPGKTRGTNAHPDHRITIPPNHETINHALQAWYRAESVGVSNGERVEFWQDESGHQRDLRPTWERLDSQTGTPPRYMAHSTIGGKPAVRFSDLTGMGSAADRPVDISGDAAWTITTAINIRPPSLSTNTSVIVGFGDPAPGHNPGRPWASLLEIRRDAAFLSHSGGYGHDARLPQQTMWPNYETPVVLTLVKKPGPMAMTTAIYLNGHRVSQELITGVGTIPDIQHRADFSVYMGRANGSLGALRADIAETAIYNVALANDQREAVEGYLMNKYGIPRQTDRASEVHPVDAFVRERLNAHELTSAPEADRRTLIRRACFDLTGLPPKPEQIDAYLNDDAPGAWERAIERLLHSPHYGERWGRHWLDVARYADTGGYETDVYYRNAWRFRDYVVDSFNKDKPFDQFVQEQIAGDEIWPDDLDLHGSYLMDPEQKRHFEALTGTGFYALGPQIHESNMDAKRLSNERLTDWVDTTASAFMGLTFGCARCHDHKFDPISQRDYYALQAVFASSREIEVQMQHGMGLADWKQHYPKVIALEEARLAYRDFERRTGGRQRTPKEKEKLQNLKIAIADRLLQLPETDAQLEKYVGVYERPTVTVLAHYRPELTPDVHLLSRGELSRPRQKMAPELPRFLTIGLGDRVTTTAELKDHSQTYGNRKDLALWLTRPHHPLTARVMINRIWQWHFGRGIVSTPNDFGKMGNPPSHPALLDWLAAEFVNQGWSIKSMHRLIMTSATYRQASDFHSSRHEELDPDNRLLWRMNRRRLEGEAVWDAIHSVSGTINLSIGGRPVMPPLLAEEQTNKSNWVESQVASDHTRRGIYVIVRRNFNFPLFDLFDAPSNAVSCSGRDVSTVAPEALWLLNNNLALHQSTHFANRLVDESGIDKASHVKRAFLLALGRPASETELQDSLVFLERLKETDSTAPAIHQSGHLAKLPAADASALVKFCQTMFNLNEFIYVD